jgi:hypothetical protein
MSDTYSRYVVNTNSNVEMNFANWQILVNEADITDGTTTSLAITPVIEESEHVKNNTIAPSSKGYFDILINPSNVEVSFNYKADFKVLNENLTDIKISKYAILDESYIEGETKVESQDIIDNTITGSLTYDNKTNNFTYKPFTIRVYFEWYEGENETMDDNTDSEIGLDAATNETKLQIETTLKFEQEIKTTTTE